MPRRDHLEKLNGSLLRASKSLDHAAQLIALADDLDRKANLHYVAVALASILKIQLQIYRLRPDLTAEHLKPGWTNWGIGGVDRIGPLVEQDKDSSPEDN